MTIKPSSSAAPAAKRMGAWLVFAICAVVGVLLFAGAYVLLTSQAEKSASQTAQDTVAFARESVQRYEENATASRTKSVTGVWEKVEEFEACFDLTDATDKAQIEDYLDRMGLTAVLLLDADRNLVAYAGDKKAAKAIGAASVGSARLAGMGTHKTKCYLSRTTLDGSTYDCASCSTASLEHGVLVGAGRVQEGDLSNDIAMFKSMFENCGIALDGVIAVADEDTVLTSNDSSLIGLERAQLEERLSYDGNQFQGLTQGSYDGIAAYGLETAANSYEIYVWFPAQSLLLQRNVQLVSGFVLYALVILVIFIVRAGLQNARLRREREYTESLERANMAKTDFLRRMSHDVRTPINGIRGMLAIGDHYSQDMDKQAECRAKMWEASSFLLDLVNSALDMNKLESGEMLFDSKEFDLRRLVASVVDVLQVQADQLDIALTCDVDVEHSLLVGSPLHVRQVLQNIGGNAVKYNRAGGSVHLSCKESSFGQGRATMCFTCEDTGIGMSEEFQEHAFEAFAQEDTDARTVYQGTGLGLAISREIVEQLGGTIKLESVKGQGTTFTIELSFDVAADAGADSGQAPVGKAAPSLRGLHVLLAEDNDLNAEVATFMLEQEGIVVTVAKDGQEVVQRFEESPVGYYDAVLMDVMMPVMDGFAACRAIRDLERTDAGTVPVIAVTANAFADDRERSIAAGMNAHVSKPLDAQKLVEALGSCVA